MLRRSPASPLFSSLAARPYERTGGEVEEKDRQDDVEDELLVLFADHVLTTQMVDVLGEESGKQGKKAPGNLKPKDAAGMRQWPKEGPAKTLCSPAQPLSHGAAALFQFCVHLSHWTRRHFHPRPRSRSTRGFRCAFPGNIAGNAHPDPQFLAKRVWFHTITGLPPKHSSAQENFLS
jgi:hypothetical protein